MKPAGRITLHPGATYIPDPDLQEAIPDEGRSGRVTLTIPAWLAIVGCAALLVAFFVWIWLR